MEDPYHIRLRTRFETRRNCADDAIFPRLLVKKFFSYVKQEKSRVSLEKGEREKRWSLVVLLDRERDRPTAYEPSSHKKKKCLFPYSDDNPEEASSRNYAGKTRPAKARRSREANLLVWVKIPSRRRRARTQAYGS